MSVSERPSRTDLELERSGVDAYAAAEWGMPLPVYRDAVRDHLAGLVADATVAFRCSRDGLNGILEIGRILPISALLGPDVCDAVLTSLGNDRAAEGDIFPDGRPVYAYLTDTSEPISSGVSRFGDVRVALADHVKDATTFTLGDLWPDVRMGAWADGPSERLPTQPAPLDAPTLDACLPHLAPLLRRTVGPLAEEGFDSYFEAQVHWPLSLADVERVDFYDDKPGVFAARLDKLGIAYGNPGVASGSPVLLDHFPALLAFACERPAAASALHGETHWRRVATAGLELAPETGADPLLVLLFALLHDAFRSSDGGDQEHGRLAADFVADNADTLKLDRARIGVLREALAAHSDGQTSRDPTIGTSWDADRLQLGRVGCDIDPAFLSTEAARSAAPGWRPHAATTWRALYLAAAELQGTCAATKPRWWRRGIATATLLSIFSPFQ